MIFSVPSLEMTADGSDEVDLKLLLIIYCQRSHECVTVIRLGLVIDGVWYCMITKVTGN